VEIKTAENLVKKYGSILEICHTVSNLLVFPVNILPANIEEMKDAIKSLILFYCADGFDKNESSVVALKVGYSELSAFIPEGQYNEIKRVFPDHIFEPELIEKWKLMVKDRSKKYLALNDEISGFSDRCKKF
jgi:hypothetical protein